MKHPTTPGLAFLDGALDEARRSQLLRERSVPGKPIGPSFCSNDYLGLASQPAPPAAGGCGASRLLGGDRLVHLELERAAARLVNQPDALVFSSGYAANVGVLSALAGPADLIVSDALNHASIIDGARLSKARVRVVEHLDVAAIQRVLADRAEARAFVVTESYFSMDADSPDLGALRRVCDEHQAALIVDEAHALGVLGPDGRGLCVAAGALPDVLIGTFGKAFGAAGAFAAGCPALTTWLWNRARSFVFSTGISPSVAAAALHGMQLASSEPGRRRALLAATDLLRKGMSDLGLPLLGHGPIVPWVVGEPWEALALAQRLRELGLDVRAVRPPTVPPGTARLRLSVTAAHTRVDILRALAILAQAVQTERA